MSLTLRPPFSATPRPASQPTSSSLLLSRLELSDANVCGPQTRACLGTTAHFCKSHRVEYFWKIRFPNQNHFTSVTSGHVPEQLCSNVRCKSDCRFPKSFLPDILAPIKSVVLPPNLATLTPPPQNGRRGDLRCAPRRVRRGCSTPHTLNPQPSTLNPTPHTLNPYPLSLNPKP